MTLNIVHKSSIATSGGSATAPIATDVEYGEIAVNYATADPALFVKDSANNVVRLNEGPGTVTSSKIAASAVIGSKIANNSVNANRLQSNSVTSSKILDLNVTTAKIADANITTAKIADANITTAKINDGAVVNVKVSADTLTGDRLVANTITTREIANGSITSDKLAATALSANFNEVAPVTLSGSTVSFTGLPSTTYYMQLAVSDYSQNTDSDGVIQVGTSSGYVSSGYKGAAAYLGDSTEGTAYTSGFGLTDSASNLANVYHFFAELILVSSNKWAYKLAGSYDSNGFLILSAGNVDAGATLDRIRLNTLSSATYDSGVAKLRYWSN